MKQTETFVVGASIAGLASAVCLQKQSIEYIVIDHIEGKTVYFSDGALDAQTIAKDIAAKSRSKN